MNSTRDARRDLTFPYLSAMVPRIMPVRPTASDGTVIISETAKDWSGKTALMSGIAGATAAPPISMSIELSSSASSVAFVGLNGPLSFRAMRASRLRLYI